MKKTAAHGCGSFFISVLLLAQSAQQGIAEFMGCFCQYGRPGQYGKGSRQADNEEIPAGSGQKGAGQCPGHLQERFGGDTAEEHDDEKDGYCQWQHDDIRENISSGFHDKRPPAHNTVSPGTRVIS